jgi:peroxiredoxin-like protein
VGQSGAAAQASCQAGYGLGKTNSPQRSADEFWRGIRTALTQRFGRSQGREIKDEGDPQNDKVANLAGWRGFRTVWIQRTGDDMHPYPHHYSVDACGRTTGNITVSAKGLPPLQTAPPAEFEGPGDRWSPETLLVGAVADCFILTFRAVARASNLSWAALRCNATGQLDRVDGKTRFTGIALHADLTIPAEADADKARRLLEKSEKACLITNSLAFSATLTCDIVTTGDDDVDVIVGDPCEVLAGVGGQ